MFRVKSLKKKTVLYKPKAILPYVLFVKTFLRIPFKIAEILVNDKDESVQTTLGIWVWKVRKQEEAKQKAFLGQYAKTIPRVALR